MVRRFRKASSGRDVPTYAENLLCVDSGEAEEAESLLAAPGESRYASPVAPALVQAQKNMESTTWKKIRVHVPVLRLFPSPCSYPEGACATGGIVPLSRRNVRQIITLDWNHRRLYFQDSIEGDTLFHARHRLFTLLCSPYKQAIHCRSSSRKSYCRVFDDKLNHKPTSFMLWSKLFYKN